MHRLSTVLTGRNLAWRGQLPVTRWLRMTAVDCWGVPAGDEPSDCSSRRVVQPPFDGADVGSVDVDPDGGYVADGCDGVDVVVGRTTHGDLSALPHVLAGWREGSAQLGGCGFGVALCVKIK